MGLNFEAEGKEEVNLLWFWKVSVFLQAPAEEDATGIKFQAWGLGMWLAATRLPHGGKLASEGLQNYRPLRC